MKEKLIQWEALGWGKEKKFFKQNKKWNNVVGKRKMKSWINKLIDRG